MAVIHIVFRLSEKGQRAALAANLNFGKEPRITLLSPDQPDPDVAAPTAAAAEALDAAKVTDPKVLAATLVASMQALAAALDPRLASVLTERATPDLWARASKLAHINSDTGVAIVGIKYDEQYGKYITGYKVDKLKNSCGPRTHGIITETDYDLGFDFLPDAETLVATETTRRANLEAARIACEASIPDIEAAYKVEKDTEHFNFMIRLAESALHEVKGFEHLPEVITLQRLVDARDPEILNTGKNYGSDSLATKAAKDAVTNAKNEIAQAGFAAWVKEHGSPHLNKLLAAGLLDANNSIYRDERLAVERPNWKWAGEDSGWDRVRTSEIGTPSEAILDLLLAAQAEVPDAAIGRTYDRDSKHVVYSRFMGYDIIYQPKTFTAAEAIALGVQAPAQPVSG